MDILPQSDFFVGPLFATFLIGFTTFILLFWYTSHKQRYWKKIGIPFVQPLPFLGSTLDNMTKPLHIVDVDRFQKYGRIYGHYEGNQALLSIAEPEILRNILVKDFSVFNGRRRIETGDKIFGRAVSILRGKDWKRVRTIVSPTFTTGKIKRMMNIMKDCSETLVKNFREASEKGEAIDAKRLYGAYTMDIIASTTFSTKIDSHNDPNNIFVTNARQFFTMKINWRVIAFVLLPKITKLLKFSVFSPHVAKFFSDTTLQIIEERKRTGQTRNDFLQLLVDTAKEAADEGKLDLQEKDDIVENYGKVDSGQLFKGSFSKKTLSHDELVAQCVTFFVAGYETTATTLAFISYSLALYPDIQERLIQEVDEALKANDEEMTYEAIQSMKYLDNVIAETLRLHPPFARMERVADEDYELGDTGLTVPKGMLVTVPVYAMHRDPKFFPNPDTFDPDRFCTEERAKQIPFSYLPFGAGPRNCLAMRFALMEIKVCIAHVLRDFRIKKCPSTKVPLDYENGMGFVQPKIISLFMERREDSVKTL